MWGKTPVTSGFPLQSIGHAGRFFSRHGVIVRRRKCSCCSTKLFLSLKQIMQRGENNNVVSLLLLYKVYITMVVPWFLQYTWEIGIDFKNLIIKRLANQSRFTVGYQASDSTSWYFTNRAVRLYRWMSAACSIFYVIDKFPMDPAF